MKVLNLGCDAGHPFEGWFGSEDDYRSQQARGLLECPVCGSREVHKRLSAPRLNLGRGQPEAAAGPGPGMTEPSAQADVSGAAAPGSGAPMAPSPEAVAAMSLMNEAWARAVRHVMSNTEDVGDRFAEEARRIHYGETAERGIRGQTSQEERQALIEEGIEVIPLPMPKGMTGPLQ